MLLSTYSVVEGFYLRTSGSEKVRRKEILENFLYFLGSLIFLLGTLIWDQMETDESRLTSTFGGTAVGWAIAGVAFFGVGSFLFALAAFFNAMNLRYTHPLFTTTAHGVAFCYEFGGLFFVAGTMGFIPSIIVTDQPARGGRSKAARALG